MEPPFQSQTNILHLPDEILFKVMKLAGCCSNVNHDIRFVCKKFFKVYCAFTSCGLTVASNRIRDDVIASMMHSLRRPSRFDIDIHNDCSEASEFKKIVKHFAVHVRTLKFQQSIEDKPNLADLAFIMRSMVNVEEVTFNELKLSTKKEPTSNPTIKMPMLKKLTLFDCDDAESVAGLLSCVSASSLEEFYVQCHTEIAFDFTQFFKNNKAIKTIAMAISGLVPNLKAFEHLQLSKLQIYFDENSDESPICDVVARQPKLKYLNLLPDQDEVPYDYRFDEDGDTKGAVHDYLFTVICSLKDLESLKLAIGQLTPDAMGKIANLTNLKELIVNAAGEEADFDNEYEYDVSKMRSDVHFQNCFQKLIATPLPKLESLTWSLKNCEWDNEYFMNDDEELIEAARQREYLSLSPVNNIATMARNFPLLKYLRIEMKTNDTGDRINARDALKLFPYLETLKLKMSSIFKGGLISIHANIKHVRINEIERNSLIEMLKLMPNLESLKVRRTQFSLDKTFLENLQAAIPDRLKKLELNFNSSRHEDLAAENVVILQNIVKKLTTAKIKLTGNCNFDSLAEKIDRSVHTTFTLHQRYARKTTTGFLL